MEMRANVAWYNLQKRGLGHEFRAQVRSVLRGIAAHPERWPMCGPKYRRAVVSRFPYVIYYLPEHDIIRVARVTHTSRDRGLIEELLP
jgi:plasmid stabilization system protein ParE